MPIISGVLGWTAFGCFLSLILKFISKRIPTKRLDRFLLKRHKTFAKLLIIFSCAHGLLSFKNRSVYSPFVYLSGLISLAATVKTSGTFKHAKRKNRLASHRFWSSISFGMVVLHCVLHIHLSRN